MIFKFRYLFSFCIVTCISPHSQAYLDPGTGTMIVQAIVGTIAAASAAAGLYWSKIKNFFKKDDSDNEKEDELNQTSDKDH